MADLIEILGTSYFRWGLVLGVVSLVSVSLIHVLSLRDKTLPIGGLLIAVSTLVALRLSGPIDLLVWIGFVVLVAGTGLARAVGMKAWLMSLASIPGAALLALTVYDDPAWASALVLVAVPVAGLLVVNFEARHSDEGLGVVFYAMAAIGLFFAVPDTELPRALMAVCLPIAFLAWPRIRVSLGPEGAYLSIALFLWITSVGGVARPGSIVGAAACLGYLVLEPVIVAWKRNLAGFPRFPTRNQSGVALAWLSQFLVVILCSRIAARFHSAAAAVTVVVLVFILATIFYVRVGRTGLPPGRTSHREA